MAATARISLKHWLIGLVFLGFLASMIAPFIWEANHVPPEFREDRWELTRQGAELRDLVEARCGPLPVGVYLDRPEGLRQPVLVGGSPELRACFEAELLK